MNPKQKIYLTLSIILAICLVSGFLVIYPLINKIKSSSLAFIEKKETLEILEKEQIEFNLLKEQYKKIEPELTKINQSLLNSEKTLDFIVALENIAEKANNNYEIKVTQLQKEPKEKFSFLTFQIYLWGSFPNLIKFLIYLENMPYWVETDQIQIRPITQEEIGTKKGLVNLSTGDVNTNLIVKVYTSQ